jgi:hypothetical protein
VKNSGCASHEAQSRSRGIEFIDENGDGPGGTAKEAAAEKSAGRMMPNYKTNPI